MKEDLKCCANDDLKCFIGLHHYAIIEKLDYQDVRGNNIGIVVVSRCINCGKIKYNKIPNINQIP